MKKSRPSVSDIFVRRPVVALRASLNRLDITAEADVAGLEALTDGEAVLESISSTRPSAKTQSPGSIVPTPSQYLRVQPSAPFPLCAAQCQLLVEVNHRVANQFTLLTSYIHLSLEELLRHPVEVRELELAFAAVEARARALASLNRQLIHRPASDEPVDVSLIVHEVCGAFQSSGSALHHVVEEATGPYLVAQGVNMAVGQIVTEAVMNALKYAYPEGYPGEITVRSKPAQVGKLLIEVADRGVGVPASSLSISAKSFGVRLMRGIAVQENIGLSFVATSPGLSVQLVVPLARDGPKD